MENYFLDETTIAKVFETLTTADSWLWSSSEIRAKLKGIASGYVSYAVALIASAKFREEFGNVDLMPKGCDGKSAVELSSLLLECAKEERTRFSDLIDDVKIRSFVEKTYTTITDSLLADTDEWKKLIPAKPVITRFCTFTPLKYDGFRAAYINSAELVTTSPFSEVIDIFAEFDTMKLST